MKEENKYPSKKKKKKIVNEEIERWVDGNKWRKIHQQNKKHNKKKLNQERKMKIRLKEVEMKEWWTNK